MSVFEWPVRVYYEDTDAGGVVYNANYLKFLERARTEWLRSLGFSQERLMREAGILFAVRKINIDYLLPARFDDELRVETKVERIGRASLSFCQRILRGPDTLLSRAQVNVACLDRTEFRPTAIPDLVLEKINNAQH